MMRETYESSVNRLIGLSLFETPNGNVDNPSHTIGQ